MEKYSPTWIFGFLLVCIVSLLNGTIPAVTQKALQTGLSIETVLSCRFFIGTSLVWLYIAIRKQNIKIGWNNISYLLAIGFLLLLCTTCMNESYKYIPGAVSSILVFLYVVIVVLIEISMGREKAEPARIICLLFSVMGLAAVVWTPENSTSLNTLGLIFAIIAAFFYALQAIGMGAERLSAISAEVVTGYIVIVPTIANVFRCAVAGQPFLPQSSIQWICVLVLGIGAAFIAPICYCRAIKAIGASDTSIINTSEPVIAYIAGILIMSDHISWNTAIGGLLIVSSIFLLNYSKR